jgi:transposase-like protein
MAFVSCSECGAIDVVKRGLRRNKHNKAQLYRCNVCRRTFVEPTGFERMRFTPEIIARAIHQHEDGFSLSKVQNHLWQHDNVRVTRATIARWVHKYAVFLKSSQHERSSRHQRAHPSR